MAGLYFEQFEVGQEFRGGRDVTTAIDSAIRALKGAGGAR